jgi:hypothetical protein
MNEIRNAAINNMFMKSNRQREIIDKIMPETFNENISDRENCIEFLRKINEKNLYEVLIAEF